MTVTLLITVIVEGVSALGYSHWRKKPLAPILGTSLFANILTQSFLWIVLNVFFQNYLSALLIAETLIWLMESALLSAIPANRLSFAEAMLLSFLMNLASLSIGWLLPV